MDSGLVGQDEHVRIGIQGPEAGAVDAIVWDARGAARLKPRNPLLFTWAFFVVLVMNACMQTERKLCNERQTDILHRGYHHTSCTLLRQVP